MNITELRIGPKQSYNNVGPTNPLVASVKISSKDSVLECKLSEDTIHKILVIIKSEIATEATTHIDDFIRTIETLAAIDPATLQIIDNVTGDA